MEGPRGSFGVESEGSYVGDKHGVFTHKESGDYLYQKASSYYLAGGSMALQLYFKRGSDTNTTVRARLYSRAYWYQDDTSPGCDWPDDDAFYNINANVRSLHNAWELRGEATGNATTEWKQLTLNGSGGVGHGIDMQLRVSTPTSIRLDRSVLIG